MPYGVKQGIKTPGEFGMGDMLGLALASSSGIIAALVTDFQAQGESSALYTINKWVVEIGSVLGFTDIPLWMVVIGLTALGTSTVFFFRPVTRQGAFAQGFALLAVLMMVTPPNLAGGLTTFSDGAPSSVPASISRDAANYDVRLRIIFSDGMPDDVASMIRRGTLRGRLHNEEMGTSWNLFHSAGATIKREGDALVMQASVPTRSDTARLWIRIESATYRIEEQSAIATSGQPLEWTIDMQPSTIPLTFQRLGKSYWF